MPHCRGKVVLEPGLDNNISYSTLIRQVVLSVQVAGTSRVDLGGEALGVECSLHTPGQPPVVSLSSGYKHLGIHLTTKTL